jgi:hypothetical protein
MHFYVHTRVPSAPLKLVPEPLQTGAEEKPEKRLFSTEYEYEYVQDMLYYNMKRGGRKLLLNDTEDYYVQMTAQTVEKARELLISERGYQAAYKTVQYIAGELPAIFFARVLHSANPQALFIACSHAGFTDSECRVVYDCRWASIAVQHARRCYQDPTYDINRVGTMGFTMLSLAVKNCAELAVYWLVRRGALPRAKNVDGSDALSIGVQMCMNKCKFAITECVHERMKLLMLSEVTAPSSQDIFVDMIHEALGARLGRVKSQRRREATIPEEEKPEITKRKRSRSRKR